MLCQSNGETMWYTMDVIGRNKCGDVYFGLDSVFVNPSVLASSFLKEFSHFHTCAFPFFSLSCQSAGHRESQPPALKYAFRDLHGCFHSSFVLFLSDFVLLNDTVCSYVENQQHNEASLAGLFPLTIQAMYNFMLPRDKTRCCKIIRQMFNFQSRNGTLKY